MLFAKVVFGLAVKGHFDYSIPDEFAYLIKAGSRVWLSFGATKRIGYVVSLSKKTSIRNIKPILELIDQEPLLTAALLKLAQEVSLYYACSWGEAIETMLPKSLRSRAPLPLVFSTRQQIYSSSNVEKINLLARSNNILEVKQQAHCLKVSSVTITLIHDRGIDARWDEYVKHITQTIDAGQSVIIILPDTHSLNKAESIISKRLSYSSITLKKKDTQEAKAWAEIKSGAKKIVLGLRSSIFAPLSNLGLIIIDEEQDNVYKQEQVPHYHTREVAFMRAKNEQASLILGSSAPSAEMMQMVFNKEAGYIELTPSNHYPQIEIIDTANLSYKNRNYLLTRYLQDCISDTLNAKQKILLFLNRRGFATSASCNNCGKVMKCPRCNINLVFHFGAQNLSCHYCNYSKPTPKICPHCNAGYIRLLGAGIEKIESELARIFPQARLSTLETGKDFNFLESDIFIATQKITKEETVRFDLVGILGIDAILNRVDFRASEKAFSLLEDLIRFSDKKMIIQTALATHYIFEALKKNNPNAFYTQELRYRKQLGFPPFKHLGLVKIRGKHEEKVKAVASVFFERLKFKKTKLIDVISVSPGEPRKLRDNYNWQILTSARNALQLSRFLSKSLTGLKHSGTIITIDIDP